MKSVLLITLGCSKNSVDSEFLAGGLNPKSYNVYHEYCENPDIVIINTCGFILDAKEESIETILEWAEEKKQNNIQKLIITGCFVERYIDDLTKEIPEVDMWFGVNEYDNLIKILNENISIDPHRILSTPNHYAYLKIAEGCDRQCSFCAIPKIRGKHISRSIDSLVEETKMLAQKGVKELIVISQDLSYYGLDLYKKRRLADLVKELCKVEGIEWIRLHYLFPNGFPEDILDVIRDEEKVCKYIDMPLQHINNDILHSMKRESGEKSTRELVQLIRKRVPDIAFRTSFIVGYPGETTEQFIQMVEFIKENSFDRLGAFQYSEEEGTPAAKLDDNVSADEKQQRYEAVMQLQEDIAIKNNEKFIGQTLKVLIDRFEEGFFIGRTEFDSPEVDQEVLIETDKELQIGEFYQVKIVEVEVFDLIGVID